MTAMKNFNGKAIDFNQYYNNGNTNMDKTDKVQGFDYEIEIIPYNK